jgi:inorganic pyrophosphatase
MRTLIADAFRWTEWEATIREHGLTIDRPEGQPHPDYPHIIYPIDYGYINDTRAPDGGGIDVFVGTSSNGLVGLMRTTDYRRGDEEVKLIYNCTPREIYTAHGFINFDRSLLKGTLVMRYPMEELWAELSGAAASP